MFAFLRRHPVGSVVLGLSGIGFPLTQVVTDRLGRRGAILTEVVATGLGLRDALMVRSGTPSRLRRLPVALLWLELAAALSAAGLGVLPIANPHVTRQSWRGHPLEVARRVAIGTLFGVHTWRFFIYLQPDHGRKRSGRMMPQAEASAVR